MARISNANKITVPTYRENKLYGQDYEKIKKALRKSNELFLDPMFPPDNYSISYTGAVSGVNMADIQWIRAKELTPNARFIKNGTSVDDVNQGYLGDCWFLSALASLAENDELFDKVVPDGQSFSKRKYNGIFCFKFYKWGQWIEVVVDDYLPTLLGKPIFLYSDNKGEAWPCLAEKAYAKLHGSYMHLTGGLCITSMENLSGGVAERFIGPNGPLCALHGTSWDLFQEMSQVIEKDAIVCTGTFLHNTDVGIYGGHAYSVTGLYQDDKNDIPRLVKIRNPWGIMLEWTGAFSDNSPEMATHSSVEALRTGIGEWWMPYDDFLKYFTMMELCHLLKGWPEVSDHNVWDSKTGFQIPYVFSLTKESSVFVCLEQKMRRELRDEADTFWTEIPIQLQIYPINEDHLRNLNAVTLHVPLGENLVKYNGDFDQVSSVTFRGTLPAGHYLVVAVSIKHFEADFYLRINAEDRSMKMSRI